MKDLDINSKKRYKKVQITYECDDCGHRENWLFNNIGEWELADEWESDSNLLVGDCPKCNSKYYNMKSYKIIEKGGE